MQMGKGNRGGDFICLFVCFNLLLNVIRWKIKARQMKNENYIPMMYE